MDSLELWKNITKLESAWIGIGLGFVIAIVLHFIDSRNAQKKLIQ